MKIRTLSFAFIIVLTLLCTAGLHAGQLPAGVSIYLLDNGLQVLLIENRLLPMTGVNVVVKTGSAYETFATSGMSHMLEHLLFNGTVSRTQKQLYDQVDIIGGYNNANTSNFYTNYMMVTPHENIRSGMEIQADMLFNSLLPAEKFEKEKGIVLEEIARSVNRADNQMERNVKAVLFPGHALSLPTLGTSATIQNMERDDVYVFYKNAYVPNNMLMSVIGNFDSRAMLEEIKRIYGMYKPGIVSVPHRGDWQTGFQGVKETPGATKFRFYSGENYRLDLFYPVSPDAGQTHAELLDDILGKKSEIIKSQLQEKHSEKFKSVEMETYFTPVINFVHVSVILKGREGTDVLTDAIDKAMQTMDFTIPPETIALKATSARTNFLKSIEKPHMFGIYNAEIFAVSGIEAVLQTYGQSNFYQAAKDLGKLKLNSRPLRLIHYPEPGKAEQGTEETSASKTVYTDPESGLTLITSQNKASELLAVHIFVKHKAAYEAEYGKNAAVLLHDCLGQRLNSSENQKVSNRFGFTYKVNDNPYIPMDDIYVHDDFSYIRAEGLADDVKSALGFLIREFFTFEPLEAEFNKAQENTGRAKMMMGRQKGEDIFKETYQSIIYEPPKYTASESRLKLERLNEFAAGYFSPENVIISVVSPASAVEIKDIVTAAIKGNPAKTGDKRSAYERPFKILEAPLKKEIESGGERSYLMWGFSSAISAEDKPALTALSLLLSDKITFDIREKQGRAYRMRAGIDIVGTTAMFYVRLGTRPENVDALIPQMNSFFSEQTIKELEEHDLKKSVSMYLGRMMFRRLSSINRAYYMAHSLYFEKDVNYDRAFLGKLKEITLEDVKKVANKYMRINNPATIVVR